MEEAAPVGAQPLALSVVMRRGPAACAWSRRRRRCPRGPTPSCSPPVGSRVAIPLLFDSLPWHHHHHLAARPVSQGWREGLTLVGASSTSSRPQLAGRLLRGDMGRHGGDMGRSLAGRLLGGGQRDLGRDWRRYGEMWGDIGPARRWSASPSAPVPAAPPAANGRQ